jgi:Ca-activated chloride channel family protein
VSFIWPPLLATLLVIPLGILAYRAIDQRRRRALGGMGGTADGLRESQPAGGTRRRTIVVSSLFVIAFVLLALASARPQATLTLPNAEGTMMLAFDVSASMAADDSEPTRMEAAKAAARELVEGRPAGVVIGVSAFSDAGLTVQLPTRDQTALVAAIDRLSPTRGTSLGQGILASLDAIARSQADVPAEYYSDLAPSPSPLPEPVEPGSRPSTLIVVLSDGENNQEPDPVQAAQAAADLGIPIATVGVGSAAGTTIDLEGFEVHTRLDEGLLRQLADMTKGTYRSIAEASTLTAVYDGLQTPIAFRTEEVEITGIVAGLALALLGIGGVLSLAWLGRLP